MIDDGDCGTIIGLKTGKWNRSTMGKPAPAPLDPPQIPHDQTRARTRGRRGEKPPLPLVTESCEETVKYCNLSFCLVCVTYSLINNRKSRSDGWHSCSEYALWSCYGAPLRVSGAPHLLHHQTQYNATDFTEMKFESLYLGNKKELSNEQNRLIGSTQTMYNSRLISARLKFHLHRFSVLAIYTQIWG
jgi:hypothetical protein